MANVEKMMPTDYISADGFGITASCKEYLYPLMRGEAAPAYDMNGMPMYVQLQNAGVPKKLPPFVPTSK